MFVSTCVTKWKTPISITQDEPHEGCPIGFKAIAHKKTYAVKLKQ